jgi:shikimate dehydrogenase
VKRFAVIGHPIAHSLSPAMHGAALAALGIEASYEARDVAPDALAEFVTAVREGRFAGANVTIPHKVAVASLCDRLEDDARAIGAVNTLLVEGGAVVGTNTDVAGLFASLAPHASRLAGAEVVILGAGGAARAALAVARRLEASAITIAARDRDKARTLAEADADVRAIALGDHGALVRAFSSTRLVIQASSATMGPGAASFVSMLPIDALPLEAVVTDLVYRPQRTALLAAVELRGLTTVDGTEMLVRQGAAALARWLDRPLARMPIEAMRAAVLAALDHAERGSVA